MSIDRATVLSVGFMVSHGAIYQQSCREHEAEGNRWFIREGDLF